MRFAVFARWFGVLRTAFQPFESIGQQLLTIGAQFTFRRLVVTAAVDMHELLQDIAVLLPFPHVAFFLSGQDRVEVILYC